MNYCCCFLFFLLILLFTLPSTFSANWKYSTDVQFIQSVHMIVWCCQHKYQPNTNNPMYWCDFNWFMVDIIADANRCINGIWHDWKTFLIVLLCFQVLFLLNMLLILLLFFLLFFLSSFQPFNCKLSRHKRSNFNLIHSDCWVTLIYNIAISFNIITSYSPSSFSYSSFYIHSILCILEFSVFSRDSLSLYWFTFN